MVLEQLNGIRDGYSGTVIPLIQGFNGLLTSVIPGKEEFVIIAIAAFIGWKLRERKYLNGGYDYWLKATVVVYIIFKIMGFGINLLSLIKI